MLGFAAGQGSELRGNLLNYLGSSFRAMPRGLCAKPLTRSAKAHREANSRSVFSPHVGGIERHGRGQRIIERRIWRQRNALIHQSSSQAIVLTVALRR